MKKRPVFLTKRNSITLPKQLREMLDLEPGDCFDYEALANGLIILVRKEYYEVPTFQIIGMKVKTEKKC